MNSQRNYNVEIKDTNDHKYAYGFDFDVMHPYMIKSFEPFLNKGSLLELGSFKGDFTRRFLPYFEDITCVEASDIAIEEAKQKLGDKVKFINSLFDDFGSGLATSKTGVMFHNRGKGFVTDPRHPNCIAPRKRPLHTLVPAMVFEGGKPYMAFGVMGAHFQPMGHVYVMSNMFDYGMDPQEALDAPRVFFEGDALVVEASVPGFFTVT